MRRRMRFASFGVLFAAVVLGASFARAQKTDEVKVAFEHVIPNAAGKKMVAVVVTYAPGAKSAPHHHASSSFIYAYVLSGAIRSQVGDEPAKIYKTGDGFYELPGSHHGISENASSSEPASLLAVFVVDTKDNMLTIPDQE